LIRLRQLCGDLLLECRYLYVRLIAKIMKAAHDNQIPPRNLTANLTGSTRIF